MALESRYADVPDRAPISLAALHGPADGVVELPLKLCWSGRASYDVARRSQCLSMYQIVITTGERSDVEEFLEAKHLLEVWPHLRMRLGPAYVSTWEERFPVLREAARQAEPALREQMRRAREAIQERYPT